MLLYLLLSLPPKPLPFVIDTPQERINRRESIWSRNNYHALQERQKWVNIMNASLKEDGVVFITKKQRRRK